MEQEPQPPQGASGSQTGSNRRPWISALVIAVVVPVLLAQAVYFVLSDSRRLSGATPMHVVLRDADSFYSLKHQWPMSLTYQPLVEFTAFGSPGERLTLSSYQVRDERAQEPLTRTITLDKSGVLTGTTNDLREGLNLLTVKDRWGNYAEQYIWFLPRRTPYDLTGITRTLVISLTPTQIIATYHATFPSGTMDADLHDLLAGHIEPALFLKKVFYSTSDDFTSERFTEISVPRPTIGDMCCVEIQAITTDAQLTADQLAALLNVSLPQGVSTYPPTTVTVIAANGVAVLNYEPPPTTAQGRTYNWRNTDSIRLDYDAIGEFDPISAPVRSVRHMFQGMLRPLWRNLGQPIRFLLLFPVLPLLLIFPFCWLRRHVLKHLAVLQGEMGLLPLLESGVGFIVAGLVGYLIGVTLLASSGAVWAAALGCAVPLVLHSYLRVPLRWLWPILSALVAAAVLCFLVHLTWKSPLIIAAVGSPLLLYICWLSRELACPKTSLRDTLHAWWDRAWLLALLLPIILALACPSNQNLYYYYSPLDGWLPVTGLSLAMLMLLVLMPLVALVATLGLLCRQGKAQVEKKKKDIDKASEIGVMENSTWYYALRSIEDSLKGRQSQKARNVQALDSSLLVIGQLLLAYFALGVLRQPLTNLSALVPIAPILGWALFRCLVHPPKPEEVGQFYAGRVLLASEHWRRIIGQVILGKIPSQNKGKASVQVQVPPSPEPAQDSQWEHWRDALFGWGHFDEPWKNGKAACAHGAMVVAILLILYGPTILSQALQRSATPFILLEALMVYFVPFVARWLLYAFILGYFFPYIRGRHGWQKGLYLALTISACILAQGIVQARSENDALGLLFEAIQVIVYLSIVGIWTFDLPRVREAGGTMADLFRTIYGVPFLASQLSALTVALAGIIQTVILGHFSSIVQAFVEQTLPTVLQLGRGP